MAGYAAFSRQMLNIADVYDDEALKRIHPTLSFLKEVDKRSGYRTKQMLVVPILDGDTPAWRAAGHQQQERPAVRRTRSRGRHPAVQDAGHRHPPAHAEGRRRPAPPRDQVRRPGGRGRDDGRRTAAVHPAGARGGQAGRAHADGELPDPPGADRAFAGQVLRRALRALQRRAASGRRRCRARSSATSSRSRAGFRWKSRPKGWSSCARTRKRCAARASCRRCFRAFASSPTGSRPRPSSRRRWRSFTAPTKARRSTSCWPT